jgi:hypothetical protein
MAHGHLVVWGKKTSHNRPYVSPPGGAASVRLAQSHGSPRHIFAALVLLRKPLFGLAKCRNQQGSYVQVGQNFHKNAKC